MDSLRNADHDNGSAKRLENIVTEFFSKSQYVILESRSPCSDSNNATESSGKRDRWFNLALSECHCPIRRVENTGVQYSRQMVVDLVLVQHQGKSADGMKREGKVIERWMIMNEVKKGRGDDGGLNLRTGLSRSRIFYKKCVLMLRSVYVMLKLLPAYKVYRELMTSLEKCEVSLVHYVSSYAEPFTRDIEAEMRRYVFEPIESVSGRLCLSVLYLPSLQDLRVKGPSFTINLIPDYFGDDYVPHVCRTNAFKLPATSQFKSSTRETSANGVTSKHVAKCQCSPAPFTSILSSPLARMTICPLHGSSKTKFDKFQNPEASFSKLSDNAVLGSLVNVLQTAAPLRLNMVNRPAQSSAAKTALDAFQELQVHINMKNTILKRSSPKCSALVDDGI